jgi:hypothetical protein
VLPAGSATAGRALVTGHDADLHCAGGGDQCHFVKVAVDYVRGGAPDPTKPVLVLDHDPENSVPPLSQMNRALDLAYGEGAVPRVVMDPRSPEFASASLSTSQYSAIVVASDWTCGGCGLNANDTDPALTPDSDAINARSAAIADFFNQGGGLFFAAGAQHGDGIPDNGADNYYSAVPLPLGGLQNQDPFSLTMDGQALGFMDDPNAPGGSDINFCPTHNSFSEPAADSRLKVAERDSTGAPETLFAEGVIKGGAIVEPPPQDPPPQETQLPDAGLALAGEPTDLPGGTHTVTASAARGQTPLAGARLLWRVDGANPATGEVPTGSDGKAAIAWTGQRAGSDTLTVFADLNGDGSRGGGEPEATHTVDWLAPPTVNKTANVEPVSGTVLIKLPPGTSLQRFRLGPAQANGFVKLTQAAQIPLGSSLDTRQGRVEVQSAVGSNKPGQTQSGQFYAGNFQVRQTGGTSRPITEMVLNEALKCQPNKKKKGKVVAAASRSRRLWGSGKGRFRTRGRHSSATVRGTEWLTKDTCNTTTTTVKSGTVIVKDFAKNKNVTVKKGHRYVARAKRR